MSMDNCTKARGKFIRAQQSETNEARLQLAVAAKCRVSYCTLALRIN
jgi:hypothetical protein